MTGYFAGEVDFNASGVDEVLVSKGESDAYVLKLGEYGAFKWVRQFGGFLTEQGRALVVDEIGHVTVAGHFESEVDFNPGPDEFLLSSEGERDIFMTKLSVEGDFIWSAQVGGDQDDLCFGLAKNSGNAIHLTGAFEGDVDFNPMSSSSESLTSIGVQDMYVLKISDEFVLSSPNLSDDNISIFPNPTTGQITINMDESNTALEVQVLDITGRLHQSKSYSNVRSIDLDIVGLPGIYLVKIKSDNFYRTFTVLKQ